VWTWLRDSGWTFAAIFVGAWLFTLVVRRIVAWTKYRRHVRRVRAARSGELDAQDLLRELGYELVGSQVQGFWSVFVDGEPHEIELYADHLVERDGLRYLAEVKTGERAPHIETASTRRQLLEYRFAFDVDGLLLVDMERGVVRRVEFPFDAS
jgi:hypothetical protein